MKWGECYLDHYARFLGEIQKRRVYEPFSANRSIQHLEFGDVFEGCLVFASLGLSHFRRELGGTLEVMMPIDDGWEEASPILANALSLAIRDELPLRRGVAISGVANLAPQFKLRFDKEAIYLTDPYELPEEAHAVQCEGKEGALLLAIFISDAELGLLRSGGPDALESLLEEQGVDPYQISRPSAA